jgi:hypothetical protein
LATLLESTERTPAWIDGWLAALAAAPHQSPPEHAIYPLFEGVSPEDPAGFQRLLELISLRSYAIDVETADAAATKARLAAYEPDERRRWAAGFAAFVTSVREAWGRRGPPKEDAKVIALIAEAATRTLDDSHLRLVSDWLAHARAKRR